MPKRKKIEQTEKPLPKSKSLLQILIVSILIFAAVAVVIIIGVIKIKSKQLIPLSNNAAEEVDINLMNSEEAYKLALPKAKEWQVDAKLANITSLKEQTGITGRSDNWDLIFVSENLKKKGFHIVISNKTIVTAEEIPFSGAGSELPENIISSKEAIDQVHQIKGYENEPIISVEMIYGPDGKQWYWGIKTAKGVVTIKATK